MNAFDSLRADVVMGANVIIGDGCTLGAPKEARLRDYQRAPDEVDAGPAVRIGERCMLASQVVLYEGVVVGDDCVVEDRVRIGYDSCIEARCRIVYGAYLCDRVHVGADARVAGFVCDGTRIGARSTVMGDLVHEYTRPHEDWWDVDEESPVIESDSVIGYGARVIGPVRIGPCAYVAAGAVVTRDVPPESVVTGVNQQTPAAAWPGQRLQGLIGFWRDVRR